MSFHVMDERNYHNSVDCGRMLAFASGDVVTLKSGGPTMTVLRLHNGGTLIECVWMKSDGSIEAWKFPAEVLVHEKPANGK